MTQLRVFLSHSSADIAFARRLVSALRDAGADVWYDEHHLGPGELARAIGRELSDRPVFIVVISHAALTSKWVQDECTWAWTIARRKPERLLLPVVAAPYQPDDWDALPFIESLRRLEAPDHRPFPPQEAITRTLDMLGLPPPDAGLAPAAPQPPITVAGLLAKGDDFYTQDQMYEALDCFRLATDIDPENVGAWYALANSLLEVGDLDEAVIAFDSALALEPPGPTISNTNILDGKCRALIELERYDDALAALDKFAAMNPTFWWPREERYKLFFNLGRYDDALAELARYGPIGIFSGFAFAESIETLRRIGRYDVALKAVDHALAIGTTNTSFLQHKAEILEALGRHDEALACLDRLLAIKPDFDWTYLRSPALWDAAKARRSTHC